MVMPSGASDVTDTSGLDWPQIAATDKAAPSAGRMEWGRGAWMKGCDYKNNQPYLLINAPT